jgi:hypothetical protein
MKDDPPLRVSLQGPLSLRPVREMELPAEGNERPGRMAITEGEGLPDLLHQTGRSWARMCAGTFFETPTHSIPRSSFILS